MVVQSHFPHTENATFNVPSEHIFDLKTSQTVRTYSNFTRVANKCSGEPEGDVALRPLFKIQLGSLCVVITQKRALRQDYTQISMLRVNPIDIERKIATPSSSNISEASPIHSLQFLKTGWDGYWAKPLFKEVLVRANQLWKQIKRITTNPSDLPTIQPVANGSVAFTWSYQYPKKELEIWLYDQPDYYAEWMLSVEDEEEENTAQSQTELLKVIKRYQEL